jgi:hypothetical protein
MPTTEELKIHTLVFRSGEWLIAQCLEYDIATQARDFRALLLEVQRILTAQIVVADHEGVDPFADIPKAPKRFWQMYKDATARLEPIQDIEIPLAGSQRPILEFRAT